MVLVGLMVGCASAPAPRAEDDCPAYAATLCGPWLNVQVEARLWPQRSRSLRVQIEVTEGGYFALPAQQAPGRVRVTVDRSDPGVQLGQARAETTDSARRAALSLPLEVDEPLCVDVCEAHLKLHTRVCREPGSCHDVVHPVHVELMAEPSSPSRLSFAWD